ncbi:hypothetical protein ACFL27_23675, partial [candidate division CSSED10-310 bacterium]
NLNTVGCYIYADSTPPTVEPGTISNPIIIPGFPFIDTNTTRTSHGTDEFNYYNCASAVNESGREISYQFTIVESGTLSVVVDCDGQVDIDIHLLTALDEDSCLIRDHTDFTYWLDVGTYYLTCDTYVSSGTELMGDYTLTCTFEPDVSPVPTLSYAGLVVLCGFLSLFVVGARRRFPQ